jgi:ABC-type branched-subunit amino acid transport system ATPase component
LPASGNAPSDIALEIRRLTVGYRDVAVASDVSLNVESGKVVALLGPNGAGKSTLLKAVVGESQLMGGEIRLAGRNVTGLRAERLARLGLGYVPQSSSVFRALTVVENLEMGGYLLRRREVPHRIQDIMQLFPELHALSRSPVSRLSGGEQRLVAIARALMLQPKVLLLDEPTANLSPKNAHRILGDYVSRIASEGAAILLVEQRVREALETAHEASILAGGRIEISGAAPDLLQRAEVGRLFLGEVANS